MATPVDPRGTASATGELAAPPAASGPAPAEPNATRISDMIAAIARIGADQSGGVTRLGFSEAEREAHRLVGTWLADLGLRVRQDAIGNTIAELGDEASSSPAIGIGSHLDSVPGAGRFDGVAGVVAAVEVARMLSDDGLGRPLRIVCFAGEEGARFGEPCLGSQAVAGRLGRADLTRIRDASGTSLADAMAGVGLSTERVDGARWRPNEWAAFLELHIEQGRTLERLGVPIGVVDVVSGSSRIRMTIRGRADHSGGTPMNERLDALVAAAEVVTEMERIARLPANRGARSTVGRLDVSPNSLTTIPGRVDLVVDIRDVDSERLRRITEHALAIGTDVCHRRGLLLESTVIAHTAPVVLPIWLRQAAMEVCAGLDIRHRVMASGAGHDAQFVNAIVPAALIFVPSRDGLSHVPEEWTSVTDIATGARVLLELARRIDSQLHSMESAQA